MGDPKAPEMPGYVRVVDQTGRWMCVINLEDLRQALELQHRSHIVTAADRKVIEAMAKVPDIQIDMTLDLMDDLSIQETRVWQAELAARKTREK